MSLLAEYRAAKRMYDTQKALEPFHGVAPTDMPHQLRVDISPAGVCIATLEANTFMFVGCHPCENYAASMAKAAEEIRAMHFLKSGCALILTLWPPDVIHGTIPIGSNQKYGSAKFVDQKMLTSPDEFELDLSYAYRAINLNSWTDAHYIGLKMDGWDIIQRVLPSGACIARHWGPLASLEALVRHFQSVFATEDIVAGIVETHHILYCKMEKGALCSLKLSDRASLKNTEDIGKTLKNFDLSKNPSIYMIDLTANPAETDLFCLQASEQEAVDMRMVEKKELSQSLKMLTPADSFSFLPIALIQGGKNAKFHA